MRSSGTSSARQGHPPLIVNGVSDHVHCLFTVPPSVAISDVMKVAKARSSRWINENRLTETRFEWQKGFAVFSYHVDQVERVKAYIVDQEAHHGARSFPQEIKDMLREHRIGSKEGDFFHFPE